jgi:hypothetical protein
MRLRRHQEFQSYILRLGRVGEQLVRFVEIDGAGSQAGGVLLLVLEEFPVLDGGVFGAILALRRRCEGDLRRLRSRSGRWRESGFGASGAIVRRGKEWALWEGLDGLERSG